jgi:hypothetical protein
LTIDNPASGQLTKSRLDVRVLDMRFEKVDEGVGYYACGFVFFKTLSRIIKSPHQHISTSILSFFSHHFYMGDSIFEVFVSVYLKSKILIKSGEIHLGAYPNSLAGV